MKKLFALMLALMLALAGVSAVSAETAAEAAPEVEAVPAQSSGTVNFSVSLNEEAITAIAGASGADESVGKMISAIVGLVNNMTVSMTSDGVDAEMFVKVKDEPVLGLAVLKDTDKMFILSDVIPNHILRIDEDAMGGSMPQISLDPSQAAALAAPFTKILEELQTRIGGPEATETTLFDTLFTVKNPINLTTKEAAVMGLTTLKEVVSQEAFTEILEQIKARSGNKLDISPEKIDAKIEQISNAKDEDLPVLDAAVYSNEAGDSMFVVNVTKQEQTVTTMSGTIQGDFTMQVVVPDKASYFMTVSQTEGVAMDLQITPQEGLLIDIAGVFTGKEQGFEGKFLVTLNGTELAQVGIDGTPDGVLSGAFSAEGKTEVGIQDLQDQTSEGYKSLMTDAQTGLIAVMGKIASVYPDFAVLLQQMMPQTQTQAQ